MAQAEKHFYEFGPFRLDPADRILLRDGQHVPLTPKAFETLMTLVENSGRVIDKDELLRKVWPDTFVEEVNLAKNVSYLRKVLGGEEAAQYIETIPRRGYRFVAIVKGISNAHVEEMLTPPVEAGVIDQEEMEKDGLDSDPRREPPEPEIPPAEAKPRANRWRSLAVWPALGLAIGVAIWAMFFRSTRESPAPPLNIVPFTSFPGRETQPAFSPDGN